MPHYQAASHMNPDAAVRLDKLFTPIAIGSMVIRNRLAMAPVGVIFDVRYPRNPVLGRNVHDFILARAQGGAGMIMMASAGFTVLDVPLETTVARASVAAARELVKAVHDCDVRIGVQLHHSGRQVDIRRPGYAEVAPSPIAWSPRAQVPREMSAGEIKELVGRYVEGAERVREAGYDFVEVKACHGYLLSSFLSPHSNRRTDEYGGDLEGRARIVTDILTGIRQRLGDGLLTCCRFNGADNVAGGLTPEDAGKLAPLFVQAGADFLSVSAGVFGSFPVIVPPMDVPPACNVPLAEAVKAVVSVPVVAAGRVTDARLAEEILQAGKADIVAVGRALLADPDLPEKSRRGEFQDVRKCIGCNQGCQDRQPGLPTTCLVNPSLGREGEMRPVRASTPKRVAVVGAGPAGLEAALVAARRGHRVTVCEQNSAPGGQWTLAAAPPRKHEFRSLLDHQLRQLREMKVEIRLGAPATVESLVKEGPDAVIVATGASPLSPPIPGGDRGNVVSARDVLAGKAQTGRRVLVIGGSGVGLDTADFLAGQGKKVTVVEMLGQAGGELGPTARWHLRHWLERQGVEVITSARVERIGDGGVTVTTQGRQETWPDFDTVVLATGSCSRKELTDALNGKVKEVYVVGDAASPRNGLFAVREGAEAGLRL